MELTTFLDCNISRHIPFYLGNYVTDFINIRPIEMFNLLISIKKYKIAQL